MRKYAVLKKPLKSNDEEFVYKIMIYQTQNDVYLFEYCSVDAIQCSYDIWYPDVESVYEEWNSEIDENGWIDIEDPLPDCQHDAFLPIRIKGRDIGNPQWEQLEILVDGQWKHYSDNESNN